MKSSLLQYILNPSLPLEDLLSYLESIIVLRKKYGIRIFRASFLDRLAKIDDTLWILLRLLHRYHITTPRALRTLIHDIHVYHPGYMPTFTILTPKDTYATKLKTYLQQRFPDSTIKDDKYFDVGLEILWEGWHYKRNLDQDIEKLLG